MSRDGTYKPKGASIVTIPVSPELHRRLRIHCAAEGRSVKWVGTEAIVSYLNAQDGALHATPAPGDGINTSSERVNETGKSEHDASAGENPHAD